MELGQPLADALRDLLLDFHGGRRPRLRPGAARDDRRARLRPASWRLALAGAVGGDVPAYEEEAAQVAASGAPFLSFAARQRRRRRLAGRGGAPRRGWAADRLRRPAAGSLGAWSRALGHRPRCPAAGLGGGARRSRPTRSRSTAPADGVVSLSLTVPGADGEARHARVDGIAVTRGQPHPARLRPARRARLASRDRHAGDGVYEGRESVAATLLVSQGPQLIAAATIGPETLDGASPFGTYAALLFDRVVSESDAADVAHYEIARQLGPGSEAPALGPARLRGLRAARGPARARRASRSQGIRDERGERRRAPGAGARLAAAAAGGRGERACARGGAARPVADALVTYLNTSAGSGGRALGLPGSTPRAAWRPSAPTRPAASSSAT